MDILSHQDILYNICLYFEINDLILMTEVSKQIRDYIRKIKWNHCVVRINSDVKINLMLENYFFMKLDLGKTNVSDDTVKKLKECHTLLLSKTNITDESVVELFNCYEIDLSCTNITDESVSRLGKCNILNLSETEITDYSVLSYIKIIKNFNN